MKETPFYFNNIHYKLFGILHEPVNENKHYGFVFCYPFEEEKLWVQRVYVNLARELSRSGFSVLRFDFMGEGDSEGDFEDSDIETRIDDIACAINQMKMAIPTIKGLGLFGLRFGATLAALAAEEQKDIEKLILWDPTISGKDYINEELRKNITTQAAVYKKIFKNRESLIAQLDKGNTINVDGYEFSKKLYDQATKVNLLNEKKKFPGQGLTIQISRRAGNFKEEYQRLKNLYRNMDLKISSEYPFWKEIKVYYSRADNLYRDTIDWLKEEKSK